MFMTTSDQMPTVALDTAAATVENEGSDTVSWLEMIYTLTVENHLSVFWVICNEYPMMNCFSRADWKLKMGLRNGRVCPEMISSNLPPKNAMYQCTEDFEEFKHANISCWFKVFAAWLNPKVLLRYFSVKLGIILYYSVSLSCVENILSPPYEYESSWGTQLLRYEVLLRYSWGAPEGLLRYSWGTPEVLLRYSWGTREVLLRFTWGSPEVLLRFSLKFFGH